MKNLLMILSGLFYINSVVAQATYTEEKNYAYKRLNSTRVRDFILFRIEQLDKENQLTYEIDVRDGALKTKNTARSKPMPEELSLTCTGTSFNILFDFLNPLKYSYEFKEEYTEDPSKIALERFYNGLLDLAKQVNTNVELNAVQNVDIEQGIERMYEFSVSLDSKFDFPQVSQLSAERIGEVRLLKSDELVDWTLWYLNIYPNGWTKSGTPTDKNKQQIDEFKKSILEMEKYLFESVPPANVLSNLNVKKSKLYYEIYILELFRLLSETNTLEEYENRKEQVSKAIELLKEYNEKIEKVCNEMEQLTLINTGSEKLDYFNEYTQGKKLVYLRKVRSVLSERNAQIDRLADLISYITENYTKKVASLNATKLHVVRIKPGKIASVHITITENDFKVADGKVKNLGGRTYTCMLKASEYTTFVAEFGLGLAYTNLLYQKYSTNTSNGITTVVGDGYDRTNFVPFTALNLIPNMGRGSIYWMLQCGVGASNSRPIIATGTGFRVYGLGENFVRNFSITLGTLWTFTKELNQLSIGQQVKDQKALDDDMKYVFRTVPKPYLGVQFNF